MQAHHILLALSFLFISFIGGCASLPITMADKSIIYSYPLSSISTPPVFASHGSNRIIALVDDGLFFLSLKNRQRSSVDDRSPALLAWSPAGERLAALFYDHNGAPSVELFTSDGVRISATEVTGKVTALLWRSEHELLLFSNSYNSYRFGTSVQQNLIRLKDGVIVQKQILHETTITPTYLKRIGIDRLRGIITPSISPGRDEIIYTKLFNPPLFTPYLMLICRNIESSAEYVIAKVELKGRDAIFSEDGESVIWSDEEGKLWQRSLWGGDEARPAATAIETKLDTNILINGVIYGNGRLRASLPSDAVVRTDDGRHYLAAWHGNLYLLQDVLQSGMAKTPLTEEEQDKLNTIRSWRASGLITNVEYAESKKRILKR